MAFPASLSVEQALKHFYRRFNVVCSQFCRQIQGLENEAERQAYALLLLKRLLVLYFLQKQGLLAGDPQYLSHHFQAVRNRRGEDHFYCRFLLPLCHQDLAQQ